MRDRHAHPFSEGDAGVCVALAARADSECAPRAIGSEEQVRVVIDVLPFEEAVPFLVGVGLDAQVHHHRVVGIGRKPVIALQCVVLPDAGVTIAWQDAVRAVDEIGCAGARVLFKVAPDGSL